MIKAIIFDMDGVLVNSLPYVAKSFSILLEEYGAKFTPGDLKKKLNVPLCDQLKEWQNEFNLPEIDLLDFRKRAFAIELSLMQHELHANSRLISLISSAKRKGIKVAVATSSGRERANAILSLIKISSFLDALVTAEDCAKRSSRINLFLKAAELLVVNPLECVVFEDVKSGIEAAKNAQMKAIAVLNEFNTKKDFVGVADAIIKDFSEIDLKRLEEIAMVKKS